MSETRNAAKAAYVAAMYELDKIGAFDGLTQQQIADALGLPNRSSVSRYMLDVAKLYDLVREIRVSVMEYKIKQAAHTDQELQIIQEQIRQIRDDL